MVYDNKDQKMKIEKMSCNVFWSTLYQHKIQSTRKVAKEKNFQTYKKYLKLYICLLHNKD